MEMFEVLSLCAIQSSAILLCLYYYGYFVRYLELISSRIYCQNGSKGIFDKTTILCNFVPHIVSIQIVVFKA